jgi:hypothetical protein
MSDAQRAEFTARVQLIAEKVGAELLVLDPGQGADLINSPLMPGKATAVEIKEALRNCSASRESYWAHAVGSAPLCNRVKTSSPIKGEVISSCLDPLEQAIESTARIMRDELESMDELRLTLSDQIPASTLYTRLGAHMEQLLAEQLKRVSAHE